MSGRFEDQIDLAMDLRHQRRRQNEAERARARKAVEDRHVELERKQAMFCGEVRPLIEQAIVEANRHLATRPEQGRLSEVSGHFTGPLHPGGSACNPIAFELRMDGRDVGETLLVELTHEGTVDATLVHEGDAARREFGWPAVRLEKFDAPVAHDLVVRYLVAVTARSPI